MFPAGPFSCRGRNSPRVPSAPIGMKSVDGELVADLDAPAPAGDAGRRLGRVSYRRCQSGHCRGMMPSVRRVLDAPAAIGLWLALTLAGIIAAFVATNAMWAVISWAIGGVAAFVLVAVKARRPPRGP